VEYQPLTFVDKENKDKVTGAVVFILGHELGRERFSVICICTTSAEGLRMAPRSLESCTVQGLGDATADWKSDPCDFNSHCSGGSGSNGNTLKK
jgi:hypothetical protein